MSASNWDDFHDPPIPRGLTGQFRSKATHIETNSNAKHHAAHEEERSCDWGMSSGGCYEGDGNTDNQVDEENDNIELVNFIKTYERYLEDKQSIVRQTRNCKTFTNNPQKALREWFTNEGHDFKTTVEHLASEKKFIAKLDLPVFDQDFELTSEPHETKQEATDEICLDACRMLDDCQLLCPWQSETSGTKVADRKRRLRHNESDDDDEEEDDDYEAEENACGGHSHKKQHSGPRESTGVAKVNTYESLMAKWSAMSMSILQLKAKLVKLDVSLAKTKSHGAPRDGESETNSPSSNSGNKNSSKFELAAAAAEEDEDELDPLDEFMSNLDTSAKRGTSMEDKIEKSRIKSQISALEREQAEVSRLIDLAKPSGFNLDKKLAQSGVARSGQSNASTTTTTTMPSNINRRIEE